MLFIWTNDNLNVNKKRNHLREGALTFSNDCAEKFFILTAVAQVAEIFQNRGYKHSYQADGCNPADHKFKHTFTAEWTGKLHLITYGFGSDCPADQHTGKECDNRHNHGIRYKIEEIKERHAKWFHRADETVALAIAGECTKPKNKYGRDQG